MGFSTVSIAFFGTDLTIRPHSTTYPEFLDRRVTVEQFAQQEGQPITLEQVIETGEFIVRNPQNRAFMQGPKVD